MLSNRWINRFNFTKIWLYHVNYEFYYIKITGIPSGTITNWIPRYDILTCEDMISFLITFFVSITTLKFTYEIETSSDLLRSPSVVFGKWSETFAWPSGQFFKCLHGKWSEISWNSPRTSLFILSILYNKEKVTGLLGETKFLFSCWKIFHSFAVVTRVATYKISFKLKETWKHQSSKKAKYQT